MRLIVLAVLFGLVAAAAHAEVVPCERARLTVAGVSGQCERRTDTANNAGRANIERWLFSGRADGVAFDLYAMVAASPDGGWTSLRDQEFEDFLKQFSAASKSATDWGRVERLDGYRVLRFRAGASACAGVLVMAPPAAGGGSPWFTVGHVCRSGAIGDADIRAAVSRISVR